MNHQCPDDLTIQDEAGLWRRIHPKQLVVDKNRGVIRPSSAAFQDPSDGSCLSIVIGDVALSFGRTPEIVMANHREYFLASFSAGLARNFGQTVCRVPVEEEPAHGEVCGVKSKTVQKAFANSSIWVIEPPTQSGE